MWTFSTISTPWPSITRASTARPGRHDFSGGTPTGVSPFLSLTAHSPYAQVLCMAPCPRAADGTMAPLRPSAGNFRGPVCVTAGLFALPASISRPCRHIASRPCLPLRRSRSAHGRRVLRQVLFFFPPRRAIPAIPSHLRSPSGFQATGTGGPYLPPFRRRASAADGGSGMAGGLRPPDPLRP